MSAPSQQPNSASGELSPRAERLAILALASGAFVMALNANVMAALGPYLKADPSVNTGDFGSLVGSAGLAGAVGAFLLGPLVDRFGRRPPMVIGMAVFSAASFAHVVADGYDQLLWARAVAGLAAGVAYSSASAAVADIVPYERRGKAMGVFSAGMFLGLPAGLPLAVVLSELGHWEWIFALQGVVGLAAMVAMHGLLPHGLGKGIGLMQNLPRLASVEVLAALGSVVLYVGSFYTAVQFAGNWLNASGLVLKHNQWMVWLLLGLCSALGSLWLARIGDSMGKRNWTNVTCLVVALCLFSLSFVDGMVGLLLVGVPLSVVSAARTGPFQALISELVPMNARGTLMGLRSAAVNLGTGLFPLLSTKLVGEDYDATLYASACGVLGALLLVVLLVKKQ